jgi:tetratricopeptide (TPR) repeat protein
LKRVAALHLLGAALALSLLGGCLTPQGMLASALIPDGTASVLLSHLQQEEEGNRKLVAQLEAKKDWEGLVKLADQNLKVDSHNTAWWLIAGYAHTQLGRHQRAADSYTEFVRQSPDDPLGWKLLAQSWRDAKQPERAVQALNNSLRVRGGTAETYLLLGESYSDLNRDLPAAAAYREAVKRNNELAQAWFGLGRASARLNRRSDFDTALKALDTLKSPLAKELAELRPGPR